MEYNAPIGVLGGTFDPVHNGHLQIAEAVLTEFPLSIIKFLPSYQPPHRTPHASAKQRVAMLSMALQDHPQFSIDFAEIIRNNQSYTIDTLINMRAQAPRTPLCFIIGADAYLTITSWHRWQELLNYSHFIVVNRPLSIISDHSSILIKNLSDDVNDMTTQLHGKVFFLETTSCAISATEIRNRVRAKQSITHLVPKAVADYIEQEQLYLT